MNFEILNLLMDVVILAALTLTIFYAMRLSRNLNNFRGQREAFMGLISQLSQQIDDAQTAVNRLSDVGRHAGKDLQNAIDDARGLLDELHIMNEAGNAIAQRLEGLTDRKAPSARTPKPDFVAPNSQDIIERHASFFIQDREFNNVTPQGDNEELLQDDEDDTMFQSKAEKELYEVLRKNKKFTSSGIS